MKLRYFGYSLREQKDQSKKLINIKRLVDTYAKSKEPALKNTFKRADDLLYITNVTGYQNLYYFIRTSDDSLLKKIDTENFDVNELSSDLESNEKVAFAAVLYICPTRNVIAIGNNMGSPRIDSLAGFLNQLMAKLHFENYELEVKALTKKSMKKDLMEMEMINSVFLDIDANDGLGKRIVQELTGDSESSIGSFRIKIEPSSGNLKGAFKKILNKYTYGNKPKKGSGIIKVGAKAKHDELQGRLLDYWLDNESTLFSNVDPKKASPSLPDQINTAVNDHGYLEECYLEFIKEQNIKKVKKSPFNSLDDNYIQTIYSVSNDNNVTNFSDSVGKAS